MYTASKDDTIQNLKGSANTIADAAKSTSEDLRVVANNAGRKVRALVHTASDEINHAKDTVTTQIRSNPVQSSAIALGLGFVLGVLFRR